MPNTGFALGLKAFAGLLDEFRRGNIVDPRIEREGLRRHVRELSDRWDQRFPGFPEKHFPFASLRGLFYRSLRDEYLKRIIMTLLNAHDDDNRTIVNPACVEGGHTRDLAVRLERFSVIGTDIDPRWNWIYAHIRRRNPKNFEFIKDSIFVPTLEATPSAVVFFGACGSVSDGAIDYAIDSHSPYLMCRTCCHENIGRNTEIAHRSSFINWFFRFKNWQFSRMRQKEKYAGFYFSDKYSKDHYPTSEAARGVSNSDEFLEVARNSADSDICRAIIDVDRCLRLAEKGYRVWYRGELFVAERRKRG